jgi:hypothetical protein
VNPAGPVIVGVLYSVADSPFGWRNVTTVLVNVASPRQFTVPTRNWSVL